MAKRTSDWDDYDYMENSASAMDCTGLIPASPVEEADLLSYEAVYHYLPRAPHEARTDVKDTPPADVR